MAAYSAYRHVELDKIGFGKRRVLKPPGGGTSELFASPPDQADSPRKVRAPALQLGDTSPITESDVPVYKPGNDSHSRLFGPPEPPKNRCKPPATNVLGLPDSLEITPANNTENIGEVTVQAETNSEVTENADCKTGGNPVTGEGYESTKSNGSNGQINGASNAVLRNRVPPGGFSSGLW